MDIKATEEELAAAGAGRAVYFATPPAVKCLAWDQEYADNRDYWVIMLREARRLPLGEFLTRADESEHIPEWTAFYKTVQKKNRQTTLSFEDET
jgi:hypothetical protein